MLPMTGGLFLEMLSFLEFTILMMEEPNILYGLSTKMTNTLDIEQQV